MVAKIALSYNMGNSGGSWMAAFCSTKPEVYIIEEWQRKHGDADRSDRHALEHLQVLEVESPCHTIGLIKGFGDETRAYAESRGGRIIAQYRHPIKVLHGTRNRPEKFRTWTRLTEGAPRDPVDPAEAWVGHVQFYAWRYRLYLSYQDSGIELVPLERLSYSIMSDRAYLHQLLSWWHQIEWTERDLEWAIQSVKPRCRNGCQGNECWEEGWEPYPNLDWDSRWDPPKREIWQRWSIVQRRVFLDEFEDILVPLGYEEWIP